MRILSSSVWARPASSSLRKWQQSVAIVVHVLDAKENKDASALTRHPSSPASTLIIDFA